MINKTSMNPIPSLALARIFQSYGETSNHILKNSVQFQEIINNPQICYKKKNRAKAKTDHPEGCYS